ncbi:hypothetical protein Mal15_38120 [Stieleria maiorica]|uniref:Uncharacterized protein n=1 Tax=Stieleria maiorica TaxID=2795974 RepID=A0A5B9MID1_9BACT|nr:hypothetical protein [Stieleria maiorica]QEF99746.1 hypothetical protein Mal15_38120 [Stieleria maiorica]
MSATMTESTTETRREALKAKIAQTKANSERIAEWRASIRDLEAAIDAAADAHSDKCAPLQQMMRDLDAKLSSGSVTAADSKKRHEILTSITAANIELETTSRANQSTIDLLKKNIRELKRGSATSVQSIENELVNTAPLDQRAECKAWDAQATVASQWGQAAGEKATKLERMIEVNNANGYDTKGAKERVAFYRAESLLAAELAAESQRKADQLRRQMIEA